MQRILLFRSLSAQGWCSKSPRRSCGKWPPGVRRGVPCPPFAARASGGRVFLRRHLAGSFGSHGNLRSSLSVEFVLRHRALGAIAQVSTAHASAVRNLRPTWPRHPRHHRRPRRAPPRRLAQVLHRQAAIAVQTLSRWGEKDRRDQGILDRDRGRRLASGPAAPRLQGASGADSIGPRA